MTGVIRAGDLDRFQSLIAGRLGLQFDRSRHALLGEVLRRRFEATGQGPGEYLSRLETHPPATELRLLARDLTVPETYFFRNPDQFRALADIVLPACLARRAADKCLRIASLGCASGEEAYSLAMVVRGLPVDSTWDVSLLGVDVNAAMLDKARRGRFSPWALRETDGRDRQRWFRPDGRDFVLDETLRASVRFEERNLAEDDPHLWPQGTYDVIFCRNVIMYFAPAQAQALVGRIARALGPGGYLFLGHAETLRGVSGDFHLRHTHNTFYYQRKDRGAANMPARFHSESCQAIPLTEPPGTETWVDAIRLASERVAALTAPRSADSAVPEPVRHAFPADGSSSAASAGPEGLRWLRAQVSASGDEAADASGQGLTEVLELLRRERFTDALAILDALPPEVSADPAIQLVHAVLLMHGGRLTDAEGECRRLLQADELSAGAHHLLALCREAAGDAAAATHHEQVAAYLDSGFAMPRLHLGLLARRAGAHADARRELEQALLLLQGEEAARVLLFGGGFSREALMALCTAELSQCGGPA